MALVSLTSCIPVGFSVLNILTHLITMLCHFKIFLFKVAKQRGVYICSKIVNMLRS